MEDVVVHLLTALCPRGLRLTDWEADLASVVDQLEAGLPRLASNRNGLRSLTAWPWIISLNLNAI